MPTKFSQFLTDNKIDPRRVISASCSLETLQPEDRRLRLAKKNKSEEGKAAAGEPAKKARSGRPVSGVLLRRLEAGGKVTGPAKQKLLRAVNHILSLRKKDPVELRSLF